MEYVTLNDNNRMPVIGFGTYKIAPGDMTYNATRIALDAGYNHIDTAALYMNEQDVSRAIYDSKILREKIFITTKVWLQDVGFEKTRKAIELSLRNLKSDYIDLYLIHQPYDDIEGSWKAMEEAKKNGLIKSIGVCNMTQKRFARFVSSCNEIPSVNQVEFNLYSQQKQIREIIDKSNCILQAWGALGQGNKQMMSEPILTAVSSKYGKTPAQIMIRFALQEGVIPIVKSITPERIYQNLDIFDFEISENDMRCLRKLDKGHPNRDPDSPGVREYLLSKYDIHKEK